VTLRVATWNVDSLNARLPRLFDRLAANAPDIVGLQDDRQLAFPNNHGLSDRSGATVAGAGQGVHRLRIDRQRARARSLLITRR